MAKRKYTRSGEKPQGYQCTNTKCKWQGSENEKIEIVDDEPGWTQLGCPECGKTEFFGLLINPNEVKENASS